VFPKREGQESFNTLKRDARKGREGMMFCSESRVDERMRKGTQPGNLGGSLSSLVEAGLALVHEHGHGPSNIPG
jgi:hypothetical protein